MLVPPNNFGMVEEDLYRSGSPDSINFPFLEMLGLNSLVWLAPEEPSPELLTFCNQNSISLYHLGHLHSTSAWEPITEEVVLQALNLLVQPATYPAIVMCNQGRHRTGTVIGCLRKLQMWCLSSILEEYRRFAGPKVRVMNEQFIELFDIDLVFE
ncbi:putative tyrosine phosphatase family protein [Microstroma glucosiphilum]|uniref:Putative tyrosine-protein phosphatase OCA1 n=1 Tax=Pseudomicrostroma glucosiphilum TaxID=1684307 RepID=A0A316UAE0_9BASI|nr:putative tyrosine phosphatase family protein [Pseudomicrostroma glucosiphilum]PWN22132.1 putative tyrosine phosphatase family protein [Pseudomicrostroma glucosiphilum]